ncbi:MAG: GtrA family protein [Synergistaceae bacterium]|nr:GtrA family protein [Synergistaceae bacterium]
MGPSVFDTVKALTNDQRVRFLIVGGINTAVGYGTFAAVIFLGGHYIVANVIATAVGMTVSYFLNKYFTFRQYKKSFTEIIRFISVYFFSFMLGNVVLYVMVDIISISPYLAGALNLIFTTLISWFGHKYFSFRS